MKNKVAPLRKLRSIKYLRVSVTKPTWVKPEWEFKYHEVPPYHIISNSKEDKLEQIH